MLQGTEGEEPFWGLPGGVAEHGELVPEALVREVLEETGLTIRLPARLGHVRQIDNRRPEPLRAQRGPSDGFLVTIWLFDVDSWEGEIGARDPDGVVHEACFVHLGQAVDRLRRTHWLELAADYLEGRIEPGSCSFERWHADGRIEELDGMGPGTSRDSL